MTRRVRYNDLGEMLSWAENIIGVTFRDDARAIGLERDGVLCAVAAFDTFSTTGCNIHVAAEPGRRWLTREFCRHVAVYPFLTCRHRRVSCVIPASNADSIRFAEHFGCTLEGRIRAGAADGGDELLYGLLVEECKWLPRTITPRLAFAR